MIRQELVKRRLGEREYGEPAHTYLEWSLLAYDVLLRLDPIPLDLIKEIAWGIVDSEGIGAIAHWPKLAQRLIAADQHPKAVEILERLLVDAEKLKIPARELWELLLEAAGIALQCDKRLSYDLYRRAVVAAEAVDDDSAKLLRTLTYITSQISSHPHLAGRKAETAGRLVHLVEVIQPFISDSKYVPTIEVLKEVAELWPDGALVVATRWKELGMPYSYLFIPILARAYAKSSYLEPEVSLAILSLAGDQATSGYYGLSLLDKIPTGDPGRVERAYTDFCWRVLKDSSGSDRIETLRELLSWGKTRGLRFDEMFQRLEIEICLAGKGSQSHSGLHEYKSDVERQVSELYQSAQSATFEGLPEILERLIKISYEWSDIEPFAKVVIDKTPYGERVSILQRVSRIGEDSWRVKYVCELLAYLVEEWLQFPNVAQATPTIVHDFFVRRALEYPFFEDSKEPAFVRLASIPGARLDLHKAIIEIVSSVDDHIGLVTAYALATLLCRQLDDHGFESVLDWTFNQLEDHMSEFTADAYLLTIPSPENWRQATAGFLWRLMSDPSRPTRWLAIRASRDIVRFDGESFLLELGLKLDAENATPFDLPGAESFWMSGRAMLLVLFQRLADECPRLVEGLVPALVSIVFNRDFPHAQIREMARQTLITLCASGASIVGTDPEAISLANRPKCCKWPREQSDRSIDRFSRSEDTDFHFNGLDTIPYWFHRLDRVFANPFPDTLARADRLITKVWNRTNDDIANYRKHSYDSDGEETYHSHGNIPTREVLQTYLEFHAMMCAAGEMVDEEVCLSVSHYDDAGDPWLEWLDEHLVTDTLAWQGDSREALPPEEWFRTLMGLIGGEHDHTEIAAKIAGFTPEHEGEILLDGQFYCSNYSGYASIRVRSAFVSKETSHALGLLANDSDGFTFELPIDDETENDDEEPGFEFLPAVSYLEIQSCLDKFDPQNGQGIGSVPELASDVTTKCNLKMGTGHRSYLSADGQIVSRVEWWDETKRSRRGDQHGHSGKRLWLDLSVLCGYLGEIEMDLLLVADVYIEKKHEQANRDVQRRRNTCHAFIIRYDGTIEEVRTGADPRPTHSQ